MAEIKVRERILKVGREKQLVTYKGTRIKLSINFQQKHCRPERSGMIYSK